MSVEQNRDVALKAFDAINKQDAAGLADVFSSTWAEEINGWFPIINATWAGHYIEVADIVAEGDHVWCRLRTSGTHSGDWQGCGGYERHPDRKTGIFDRWRPSSEPATIGRCCGSGLSSLI